MCSVPFSVLMCVYKNDNPTYFKQALESVSNQTVRPSEIVLVIDGPIPKKNKLVIQKLTNYKKHPETSILGGIISEFRKNINISLGERSLPSTHSEKRKFLKMRCPMNHMTVMFKKSKVIEAGGYLDWHYNEDYYLWIRMYLSGAIFSNLNDIIVYARVNDEFYLRRGGWKYFVSESKLQYFMFQKNIINIFRLSFNILIRFFVQFVVPNKFREWLFLNFFRK